MNSTIKALIVTVYEYLSVAVPVGLYIALEATHEKQWHLLWDTPKWSMATIFLLFQGLSLYVRFLNASGGRLSATTIGLFGLVALLLIVIAVVNAWNALDPKENSAMSITIRLGLLAVVSVGFCVVVWAATLYQIRRVCNGQVS